MRGKNNNDAKGIGLPREDTLFLPDFCGVRTVFVVVVSAQLLAFLVLLARMDQATDPWGELGLVSLFVQWVALSSAALLCIARPLLRRLGNVGAGLASYGLVLLATLAVSELAYWIMGGISLGSEPVVAGHAGFLARNLAIGAIVGAVALRYLYVQHRWRRNLEAEARARFQALQARIRPHFLFNSMNTIASLTRSRPDLAETAVEDLADLFRAALGDGREQVSLAEELEFGRRYLNIERLRLGERLTVDWDDVDALPQDIMLPALTLQPLLENAVYHGIAPLPEGGTVQVSGRCDHGMLTLAVSNPIPSEPGAASSRGNRMALENIRQRLEAVYGNRARLTTETTANQYRVIMSIPCGTGWT
ncbi:MAG: sensor histidine kinase [Gammaproteobacteria bacterium]